MNEAACYRTDLTKKKTKWVGGSRHSPGTHQAHCHVGLLQRPSQRHFCHWPANPCCNLPDFFDGCKRFGFKAGFTVPLLRPGIREEPVPGAPWRNIVRRFKLAAEQALLQRPPGHDTNPVLSAELHHFVLNTSPQQPVPSKYVYRMDCVSQYEYMHTHGGE